MAAQAGSAGGGDAPRYSAAGTTRPPFHFAHVQHVLAAEFDIDKGSQLSFEYPEPTGYSTSSLAEVMLPDGAHLHEHSWSTFFLNRSRVERKPLDLRPTTRPFIDVYMWQLHEDFDVAEILRGLGPVDGSEGGDTNGSERELKGASVWTPVTTNTPHVTVEITRSSLVVHNSEYSEPIMDISAEQFELRFWDPTRVLLLPTTGEITCAFAIQFISTEEQIYFLREMERRLPSVLILHGSVPLPLPDTTINQQMLDLAKADAQSSPKVGKFSAEVKQPLLYGLILVHTKQIVGVRRGARVKSLAITSQHPWLHVFKPVLMAALDQFFLTPQVDVLKKLYEVINRLDIQSMPTFNIAEKTIIRNSDSSYMFNSSFLELAIKSAAVNTVISAKANAAAKLTSPVDDYVSNNRKLGDDDTDTQFLQNHKSLWPTDRHFYDAKLCGFGKKLLLRIPVATFNAEVGDYSIAKFFHLFNNPQAIVPNHSVGAGTVQWIHGVPFHWHPHLDWGPSTNPICVIIHAILTEKKVLVIGNKRSTTDICEMVLAAANLASCGGSLISNILDRCYPYTSLANVDDLLNTPGYIAGVANPVFEEQSAWWDVLCNINTGKITISPKLTARAQSDCSVEHNVSGKFKDKEKDFKKITSSLVQELNARISKILTNARIALSCESPYAEYRARFFLHKIPLFLTRLVICHENTYGSSTKIGYLPEHVKYHHLILRANSMEYKMARKYVDLVRHRVDSFRRSISYSQYRQSFTIKLRIRPNKDFDSMFVANLMRRSHSITYNGLTNALYAIQDSLCGITSSDDKIIEFLSEFDLAGSGIAVLGSLLYNSRWEVRHLIARILRRISLVPVGHVYLRKLSEYFRIAYDAALVEFEIDSWPLTIEELTMPLDELDDKIPGHVMTVSEYSNFLKLPKISFSPTKGTSVDARNIGLIDVLNEMRHSTIAAKMADGGLSYNGQESNLFSYAFQSQDSLSTSKSEKGKSTNDLHKNSNSHIREHFTGSLIEKIKGKSFKRRTKSMEKKEMESAVIHDKGKSIAEIPITISGDSNESLTAEGSSQIPITASMEEMNLSTDTLALNEPSTGEEIQGDKSPLPEYDQFNSTSTLDVTAYAKAQGQESDSDGGHSVISKKETNEPNESNITKSYSTETLAHPTVANATDRNSTMTTASGADHLSHLFTKQYLDLAQSMRASVVFNRRTQGSNMSHFSGAYSDIIPVLEDTQKEDVVTPTIIKSGSVDSVASYDSNKFELKIPANPVSTLSATELARQALATSGTNSVASKHYSSLYQRLLGVYSYHPSENGDGSGSGNRSSMESNPRNTGTSRVNLQDNESVTISRQSANPDNIVGSSLSLGPTLDNRATLYFDDKANILDQFRQEDEMRAAADAPAVPQIAHHLLRTNQASKRVSDVPTLYSRPSSIVLAPQRSMNLQGVQLGSSRSNLRQSHLSIGRSYDGDLNDGSMSGRVSTQMSMSGEEFASMRSSTTLDEVSADKHGQWGGNTSNMETGSYSGSGADQNLELEEHIRAQILNSNR